MKARPFLKWVGGKARLVQSLLPHVPKSYNTYREPFVGGGALLFALSPKKAAISDSSIRLCRAYIGVRDHVDRVIELLSGYCYEKEFFLEMRRKDVDSLVDAEVAAWLIYLNKTCFNGLYRVNSKNVFNVPFGRYDNPTICDKDNLLACSEVLQGVEIQSKPFEHVLETAESGDVVYFDPPYVPVATASFTSYTADGFSSLDHERLRDVSVGLGEKGVTVILSNSSAGFVRELYDSRFVLHEVNASRSVNCKGGGRGRVKEYIITLRNGV